MGISGQLSLWKLTPPDSVEPVFVVYAAFLIPKEAGNLIVLFSKIVFDTVTQFVPEKCHDWNESPEEAMMDYYDNCR